VTLTASATGLTSAAQTFTVDPAPVATIDSAPANPSTSADATFDYSANNALRLRMPLDGAAYATCPARATARRSYGGLASGSHTFDVRAQEQTSATGPAALPLDGRHDEPDRLLSTPADARTSTPRPSVAATATDTGTGVGAVDFEFSSTPGADCSTGSWILINTDTTSTYDATWTTPADGAYALRAVAHDGATHASCSLVHVTVDPDSSGGNARLTRGNVRGSITLHATGVADATSGPELRQLRARPERHVDVGLRRERRAQGGGAFDAAFDTNERHGRPRTTSASASPTSPATSPSRSSARFRVDTRRRARRSPQLPRTSGRRSRSGSTESDAARASRAPASRSRPMRGHLDDRPGLLRTTTKTDGDYDLRAARPTTSQRRLFAPRGRRRSTTRPVSPSGRDRALRPRLADTWLDTSDAGSGLATTRYELSAHGANSWSTDHIAFDTATKADGDYDFRVVAIDNAGNRTDSAGQLRDDRQHAPSAQLDDPAASAIKRGTITLTSTVSDATSASHARYRGRARRHSEATPCDSWARRCRDLRHDDPGRRPLRLPRQCVDRSGNGFCSPIQTSVRVDNTATGHDRQRTGRPAKHRRHRDALRRGRRFRRHRDRVHR